MALVIAGFAVVALPLFAAILVSSLQVGRLARYSEDAVQRSVEITQGARALVEQVTAMERSARQYLVLKDESRLYAYHDIHGQFQANLAHLAELEPEPSSRERLAAVGARAREIHGVIASSSVDSPDSRAKVNEFAGLASEVREILTLADGLVGRQVDTMRIMAAEAQRLLYWQSMALIPAAVMVAALFFLWISRPVRQVDQAIRDLGDGQFEAAIRVGGPRDMEALGERLDWLRRRLRGIEEEKTQFLRHISHELKTPLAAVREGADLLEERLLGPLNDSQLEVTRILQHNALRLQRLIEDLLAFSRLREVRGVALAREDVALADLVGAVLADHRLALIKKSIDVQLDLAQVVVTGDRAKLHVVVDNLFSNAVKYTPNGGQIRLRLERDGERAVLDVSDSGPGIPVEERAHIFDAFYQGRTQPEGPIRGTGLGLAIARECALAHGGGISVVAQEGPGACLRLVLPSARPVMRA
jgi:two-component system sensor histidine kinase GlrK